MTGKTGAMLETGKAGAMLEVRNLHAKGSEGKVAVKSVIPGLRSGTRNPERRH
jgi:hypothetical protein